MSHRLTLGLSNLLVFATLAWPASAQMQLPGANNGNQPGAAPHASSGGSAGGPTATPAKPVYIKPPSDDTIIGHALARNGKEGAMTLERGGTDLTLTKLTLAGDKISRPQETCTVDIALSAPIVLKAGGRPAGASRYDVPLEACPFTIDVLEGAVLVSRTDAAACQIKAADCQVAPTGLWGPHAAEISAKQAKDLEHNRPRMENVMRSNFRALLKKAGKDKAAIKTIAGEQAAFSSEREVMCRDYDQEPVHGFCSTQMTQRRALDLLARFGPVEDKAVKHAGRPKAKAAVPDAPAPVPEVPDDGR